MEPRIFGSVTDSEKENLDFGVVSMLSSALGVSIRFPSE